MLDDPGEGGESVFGDLAIVLASAQSLKAEQGGGCGGISGRGGRVLQRFAPGGQSTQGGCADGCGSVEERACGPVVEAVDHGVGQLDGGPVEAHIAAGMPSVDAGVDREGVVVECTRDLLRRFGSMAVPRAIGDDVGKGPVSIPGLFEQAVEREQGEVPRGVHAQDAGRLQVGGDRHCVPAGIKRAVDERRGALAAGRKQLLAGRVERRAKLVGPDAGLGRQFFNGLLDVEDVLGRVVVHVAQFADVPIQENQIQLGRGEAGGGERLAGFGERPGKVVAVVVQVDVGVLRGIEPTALAVVHGGVEPVHNLQRCRAEILAGKALKAVQVVAQQLGVVVEHLLKVWNDPAFVHAVAVEAAGQLVVDAAARHLFKRGAEGLAGLFIAAVHGHFQQQVQGAGVGKLGLRAEAAIARVELRKDGGGDLVYQRQGQFASAAGKTLIVLDGGHHAAG